MALLRITSFGGEVPVQSDRMLPDAFATESVNTWLYSGELRGLHPSTPLKSVLPTTRKTFRIPRGSVGGDPAFPGAVPPPSYLGDSAWMQFTDPDTDIIRGPLTQDSFKRFYFCSPSTGPRFNTLSRLIAGESDYKLGVPQPVGALGVSIAGGVAVAAVTRAYLYTNVNIYGEESGPSLPVTAAGLPDGTWSITGIADPTTEFNDYAPIMRKNLYRTITATGGQTTYFKLSEIDVGVTAFDDNVPDTDLSSNLEFEFSNGHLPPLDLEGFIAMPNGFLVGWVGSDIYFSEAYALHSWPVEYVESTEYPIVGMGVFGQTCAVLTSGFPSALSGISPITCVLVKTTVMEPCLSRGSIINTPDGVYYASPNGLCALTASGVQNITQQLITKEEWSKDFEPQFLRAVRYQQGYLAIRAHPDESTRTAFYLDLSALKVAVTELSEFDGAWDVYGDVWSGEVFTLKNSEVYRHDPPTDFFLPYRWKSKEFQYLKHTNFACFALFWDQDRADLVSTDAPDILAPGIATHVKVYADRRLVYDQNVPRNGEAVRLPSGFKATTWQFELTGRAPVYQLHIASTIKELRGA